MNSLTITIQRYGWLMEKPARNHDCNLAAIGGPLPERVRFHTFEELPGSLESDLFMKLAAQAADERYLAAPVSSVALPSC